MAEAWGIFSMRPSRRLGMLRGTGLATKVLKRTSPHPWGNDREELWQKLLQRIPAP